jgi:glutaminase
MAAKLRFRLGAAAIFAAALAVQLPAQRRSPVAPRDEQVKAVVNEAYGLFKNDPAGKNADYIPYLAKVDAKLFGIAVVTTDDNQSYVLGDTGYSFSIQSYQRIFDRARWKVHAWEVANLGDRGRPW